MVFYDPFHLTSIWIDVFSSFVKEVFLLFGSDNFLDELDQIVPEICGSMVLLVGLYTYITKKHAEDPRLTETVKKWNVSIIYCTIHDTIMYVVMCLYMFHSVGGNPSTLVWDTLDAICSTT